ncbi:MAG: hypothetical protein HUU49_03275 [Candidatus Buchananbacteria bacterium]|nr:hypothetical protein [Candidatus Buchananbacteria bacterium]
MRIILPSLLFVLLISLISSPALALDTGLQYGAQTGLGTKDLRESIMSIVRVLFGFLGVLAIAGIVFGGFLIMLSGGDQKKNSNGRAAIAAGVIGMIIVFSAYALASFVINQLISATGAN